MKKTICLMLTFLLLLCVFAGCKGNVTSINEAGKPNIVVTIFPIYDWIRNLLGDTDANLTLLLDSGTDLHSFQPSAEDIARIITCDVFVYVGGESDRWVNDALKQASRDDMVVVNLMDALRSRVKEEEVVGSMQEEADDEGEEGGPEYDEHVWLSLKNAEVLVEALCSALTQAVPEQKDVFSANCESYKEKLKALDLQYEAAVADAHVKTLVFADRFPFRYMTDDYGLAYDAAFVGCSAETEASFETIASLAQKVDELKLHYVCAIEGRDHSIAETVIRTTVEKNQEILLFNSLQSVNAADLKNGADYLDIMSANLETLKTALQ